MKKLSKQEILDEAFGLYLAQVKDLIPSRRHKDYEWYWHSGRESKDYFIAQVIYNME